MALKRRPPANVPEFTADRDIVVNIWGMSKALCICKGYFLYFSDNNEGGNKKLYEQSNNGYAVRIGRCHVHQHSPRQG